MIRRRAFLGMSAATAAGGWLGRADATTIAPPGVIGARAAEPWLKADGFMRYDVGDVHAVHYAEVATAYGALRLAAAAGNRRLAAGAADRYRKLLTAKLPNTRNHVDANVEGVWPLSLAGPSVPDRARGLAFAEDQWRRTGPDGLTTQARYWIDDIWMIGVLQLSAWRVTGERRFLDRAALTARRYLARLQQPNGLFHHGPDAPFFWGRGNGWVAAGLAEVLSELPAAHPHHATLLAGYRRMMAALLAHQAPGGLWRQLIDRPKSSEETSGSAMFGYAMAMGVRRDLLDRRDYERAVHRAWAALLPHLGRDGRLSGVCVGTGQSRDEAYYLRRPTVTGDLHGQAAFLWFAAEMARGGLIR